MFVRAVWRSKPALAERRDFRSTSHPVSSRGDALALAGSGFEKMTQGLFDR